MLSSKVYWSHLFWMYFRVGFVGDDWALAMLGLCPQLREHGWGRDLWLSLTPVRLNFSINFGFSACWASVLLHSSHSWTPMQEKWLQGKWLSLGTAKWPETWHYIKHWLQSLELQEQSKESPICIIISPFICGLSWWAAFATGKHLIMNWHSKIFHDLPSRWKSQR